jgi:hypothetical protein
MVVKAVWFEVLIMITIAAVGIGIGLGLGGLEEKSESITSANRMLDRITFFVFFFEAIIKIFACGTRPWVYFMSEKDGNYNTFDFVIVVVSTIYSPYFLEAMPMRQISKYSGLHGFAGCLISSNKFLR